VVGIYTDEGDEQGFHASGDRGEDEGSGVRAEQTTREGPANVLRSPARVESFRLSHRDSCECSIITERTQLAGERAKGVQTNLFLPHRHRLPPIIPCPYPCSYSIVPHLPALSLSG
jgi:hypothetical protein